MARRKRKTKRRFAHLWSRKWDSGRVNWYATWRDPVQKRRVTRALGDNRDDAEKFLIELETRFRLRLPVGPIPTQADLRGGPGPASSAEPGTPVVPVFTDFAHHLLEERLVGTLAPNTLMLYRANLAALRGFFGTRRVTTRVRGVEVEQAVPGRRLDEITPALFMDYRVWRRTARRTTGSQRKPVSDAALNRDQQFATMVLNHAVAEGLIERNLLAGCRKLKEQRKGRRLMTKAEVSRLLLAADEAYRSFLMASLFTGCRPCELRALRWRDVAFEGAKLRIDRKKVKGGDLIDLHPTLAEELRQVRERRTEAAGAVRSEDHVFLNRRGVPWRDMRKAWRRTLAAAGLAGSGLTPYATRHSFACHYLTCGGNLVDLASQLGHSDVKTTMVYSQMMDERRRAGVMAIDWSAPAAAKSDAPAVAAEPVAESVA